MEQEVKLDEKENKVIDAVEDAIIGACDKYKKGEAIDVQSLQALYDGIRILHHVQQMKGQIKLFATDKCQ